MANSEDPDQTAPEGAVWSGSALFAYGILLETLAFKILGHLPYFHCGKLVPLSKQLYTCYHEHWIHKINWFHSIHF